MTGVVPEAEAGWKRVVVADAGDKTVIAEASSSGG